MSKLKYTARVVFMTIVAFMLSFCTRAKEDLSTKQITKAVLDGRSCEQDYVSKIEVCNVPGEIPEQLIAERAVENCLGTTLKKEYAYQNALMLLRTEKEMQFPASVRGFSLASACKESGFNAGALGDHSFSKDKKTPMAVGILQMWPWYATHYKINRKNAKSAAKAWMHHIKKQKPYVDRVCKPKNEEEAWRLALVHGIRSGKKGGRCKENTSHWVLYKKMNLLAIDNI